MGVEVEEGSAAATSDEFPDRLSVLYLSAAFPFPLESGYLRHYHLLRQLDQRHCVTLVSLVGDGFRDGHLEAVRPHVDRVVTVGKPSADPDSLARWRHRLRSVTGLDGRLQAMRDVVVALSGEGAFDVAVTGKRTLPALDDLPHVPIVADMCDASSAGLRRSLRYGPPARIPVRLVQYGHTRRSERRLARRASHLVFISGRDRADLLGTRVEGTTIIPNGVDLDYWRRSGSFSTSLSGGDTIVFTGAMSYAPNADAARTLIHEVLPLVRAVVPGAQVAIVGRDPGTALLRDGQQPGVTVTGRVEDVRPYLEAAAVFAAPLRFGAGMQNKILEALAMELAVVASPLAAAGLRTADGEEPPLTQASTPREFADRILERLGQPGSYAHGRHFVAEHFSWSHSAATLESVLRGAARWGRSSPATGGG